MKSIEQKGSTEVSFLGTSFLQELQEGLRGPLPPEGVDKVLVALKEKARR